MADIQLTDMQQAAFAHVTKKRAEAINQVEVIDRNIAILQGSRKAYQAVVDDADAKLASFLTDVGGSASVHGLETQEGVLVLVDQVVKAAEAKAKAESTETPSVK